MTVNYPAHGARGICRCDKPVGYWRPNGPGPGSRHHENGEQCPTQPSTESR